MSPFKILNWIWFNEPEYALASSRYENTAR